MTLQQALADHARRLRKRGCSERTNEQNEYDIKRFLADWLERELHTITRQDCEERHALITEGKAGVGSEKRGKAGNKKDGTMGGHYAANRTFRVLRAVWNSARKRLDLPVCPTIAVEFNQEHRRQEPIEDLGEWYRKLTATQRVCVGAKGQGRSVKMYEERPVVARERQTLMLTLLFLGCRSAEACSLEWEHVDLNKKTAHFPRPKGGAARRYTVPIPEFLVSELQSHASYLSSGGRWVFPSPDSESGHVEVSRQNEYRKVPGHHNPIKRAYLPSAHRLRDTYCTVAAEIGIDWVIANTLVNHKLPGVHGGYVKPNVESLRPAQERMAHEFQIRLGILKRDETIKIAS